MVHTFTALGVYVAVDVNSGAVHVLDKTAYDLLEALNRQNANPGQMAEHCPADLAAQLPQYSAEALEEAWQELRGLQEEGLLFVEDDYIDPAAAVAMQREAPIKALCLHVSHDCNLRCKYCFASTGDFGTGHRMTMDFETAKRAIDFVIERSGKRRNIEVDFFGGEPLMAMDTVKKTVEYARSIEKEHDKCFRFTITTNGVLLNDENIEYINREMSNAVLSIDGRKEVNDQMCIRDRGDLAGGAKLQQALEGGGTGEVDDHVNLAVKLGGGGADPEVPVTGAQDIKANSNLNVRRGAADVLHHPAHVAVAAGNANSEHNSTSLSG